MNVCVFLSDNSIHFPLQFLHTAEGRECDVELHQNCKVKIFYCLSVKTD